jgi:hypothetical protein
MRLNPGLFQWTMRAVIINSKKCKISLVLCIVWDPGKAYFEDFNFCMPEALAE